MRNGLYLKLNTESSLFCILYIQINKGDFPLMQDCLSQVYVHPDNTRTQIAVPDDSALVSMMN